MITLKDLAEMYAERFRLDVKVKGWYQQKVDDFTAGYESAIKNYTTMSENEKLLAAYKEGFNSAVESLKSANELIKNKKI